jgi:RES domain-containing protein
MKVAWRIVKERHAATAFDGEGARLFGGRWNSQGTRVIYTSGSQALAVLESLVHLNPPVTFRYVAIPIEFEEGLVTMPPALPADWTEAPPPPSTQEIGDLWVREARSAMLEIPSVIIPTEPNYLLNPAHPDFRRIRIGSPIPFAFDPRLIQASPRL